MSLFNRKRTEPAWECLPLVEQPTLAPGIRVKAVEAAALGTGTVVDARYSDYFGPRSESVLVKFDDGCSAVFAPSTLRQP